MTAMRDPDITCVVNIHREGLLAHRTFRSLERAREACADAGLRVETVIIADRADTATLDVARAWAARLGDVRVLPTAFGDPGLARNAGVGEARGAHVAFLDGDDLFCRDWLVAAHRMLLQGDPRWILEPELKVYFGGRCELWPQPDQGGPGGDVGSLIERNLWGSLTFARRDAHAVVRFAACPPGSGFGFEDWHWNTRAVAAGFCFRAVPRTAHFIRAKPGGVSLSAAQAAMRSVIPPTPLFDPGTITRHVGPSAATAEARGARVRGLARRLRARLVEAAVLAAKAVDFATLRLVIDEAPAEVASAAMRLRRTLRDRALHQTGLPAWLADELRVVAEVEPELFPSRLLRGQLHPPRPLGPSAQAGAYVELCRRLADWRPTAVILAPWLKPGGADLGVLHHARALQSELAARTLVVTTENAASPWGERLESGVRLLPFGELTAGLTMPARVNVLTRLLLQLAPSTVHGINSHAGWLAFSIHGAALASAGSRLFASLFSADRVADGQKVGYYRYLFDSWPHLTAVLSDNQAYLDELERTYGLDRARLRLVRFPAAEPPEHVAPADPQSPAAVLWAGRLTRSKRPELLVQLARAMPDVSFEVYGYPDGAFGARQAGALARLHNVRLHGRYASFAALTDAPHRLFLHTSAWDGMPNVLLEAVASGLPIVASAVGGVPELINVRTGYLVDPPGPVDGYVRAIRDVLASPREAAARAEAAARWVREHHGWSGFVEVLRTLEGYSPSAR